MKLTCKSTISACFLGSFTQAVAINLLPLLYVTFRSTFGLTLGQISILIAVNFGTQLTVDALSSRFILKIGYRAGMIGALLFAAAGLCGFSVLPYLLNGFAGLLLSDILAAIGCGLIEVLVSPMIEACPTPEKEKSAHMSLLHSFYCWGQATVILLSSVWFFIRGTEEWRFLPLLWAIIPLLGVILFCFVPVYTLPGDQNETPFRTVLSSPVFWLLALMMVCAGASEMIMSQWASTFAETGLGVTKAIGDLTGPLLFALLMGSARLIYARYSERLRLTRFMTASLILCIFSYLLASFSPIPALGLAGCALCGFSVGILWPGTFSIATGAGRLGEGGVTMFALLALFGDVGCLAGPSLAGKVAELCGGSLQAAFLFALLFPAAALGATAVLRQRVGK